MKIPNKLKIWFIVHFIIDITFAIPLIFFPNLILNLLEISTTESITARLVGAALLAIGGTSFITKNKGKESYESLLTLKIIWSIGSIIGMLLAVFAGASNKIYSIILIFAVFSGVWIYYKNKLNN